MANTHGLLFSDSLHQSRGCTISRARRHGDPAALIVKQRLRRQCSEYELALLRHEYDMLATLALPGVARALEWLELDDGPAIVFPDLGAEPLRATLAKGPRPWQQWLDYAIALARILGRLHEARVTHKQISPDHLLVGADDGAPQLVDFSLATRLTREQADWDTPQLALAHLPYIAPEQTGRINRAIDYRTDFYSYGCTLYELFTGRPPFSFEDPLALVHSHIAKPPAPPHLINRVLPETLSAIVLKLLAKDAAERYQSTRGFIHDLEECRAQWLQHGSITPFAVGGEDTCARFEIPHKLYGREDLLRDLILGCDRCATGGQMLMLISGHTGVGKSSVVHALREYVGRGGGRFSSGKFDQFRRDRPYFAVIQALQGLVRELLVESEERVARWRQTLLERLGNNVAALLKLIPELEHITGGSDAGPAPLALDEQSRFRLFTQFIGVLANPDNPLVLFLDDLQWADLASLQLLESLARTPSLPGLLLIASYRDDELRADHPLEATLERLRTCPITLHEHRIKPLLPRQVNQLVADTLHTDERATQALAGLCYDKTQGNPFFLNQFLHSLYEEQLIDFRADRWTWDEAAIRSRELADNVVTLMVGRIQRLPARTQKVLPLAACIGGVFDLRTLTVVNRGGARRTADDLAPAIAEGLVAPLDNSYRLLEQVDPDHTRYRFVHDRIQQAAYSLIDEHAFKSLHLLIGEQMQHSLKPEELEQRVFEVANHLNLAIDLLADPQARLDLAALNLKAGRRAKESAAFDSALDYLRTGLRLLPADCWRSCYELALELHLAATEVANIKMDFGLMDGLIRTIDEQAHSLLEKVRTYEIRIQSEVARNRFGEALGTAVEVLSLLGVHLPPQPNRAQIWLGLLRTRLLLRRVPGKRIVDIAPMTDARTLAALPILASLFGVVKFSSSALRPLVMARQVELTLRHGLTDYSTTAFAGYGGVLCGYLGAIDEGYRIGQLGVSIDEQRPSHHTRHKTLTLFNCYVRHYKEPLRHSRDGLLDSLRLSLDCGDMEYAAYSLAAHIQYAFPLSTDLAELQARIGKYVAQLRETGQKQSLQYSIMTQQTVANLRGQCANPTRLDGDYYAEDAMLAEHQRQNHRTAICVHHFYKALLCAIFGDADATTEQCTLGIAYLPYVAGTTVPSWFHSLEALALLDAAGKPGSPARLVTYARVRRILRRIRHWSRHCPANNAHRVYLIEAELLRVRQRHGDAVRLYEQAIRHAADNGYTLEAAMACELAARAQLEAGNAVLARGYLAETWRRYRAWGASAKLEQLRRDYAGLLDTPHAEPEPSPPPGTPGSPATPAMALSNQAFDITSVIKASQAISDEIVLERLLGQLMRLALTNAGAQRGIMVLNRQGRLYIEAEARVDEVPRFFASLALDAGHDHLPVSIVNYVARTKETVVVDDAFEQQHFRHDKYIRAHHPRALLCMPILYHGELTAVLYIEHAGSPSVFDQTRLETLKILAAQAAISIENAKLYQDLQHSEREYRSLFENALEGIFRVGPDGRFISANPALVRLLGYTSSDDFLQSVTDVSRQCFIDQDDLRRFLGTLHMRNRVVNFETRWQRRDGAAVVVSISARRVLDPNQSLLYYEGSLTDIGERKAKEQAELAREKAEAASEAKSHFLATMSHEIRTPLNGILGMAQLLLRGELQDTQQLQVNALYQSGRALLAILNDVLDFTKIEAGQAQLERLPFSPAEVIAELHPMLHSMASKQDLQLLVRAEPDIPACVLGDRRALTQILLNLATNALKFTPAGFVALRAQVSSRADGRARLRFEIEDSGIGIPAQAHERVFEHFSQADSSITRRFGGTGLGLSICRRLVALHGGSIDFTSTLGQGSLFWFEIEYPETSVAAPPAAEAGSATAPLDILLVEDTEINQQVTQGLLASEGHAVAIADDGYTALSMHNDHDYDLILMDIHLPDMDGLETARRMRAHLDPRKAAVRIVALTASIAPAQVQSYLAAGIDAVVGKPLQFDELCRALLDPAAPRSDHPPAPAPARVTDHADLLNTTLLAQHRDMLGENRYGELIAGFVAQSDELMRALDHPASDAATQSRLLHKMCGACANFGLQAVASECQRLEQQAHDGTRADLGPLRALLSASLNRLEAHFPVRATTATATHSH
ncbi:MAG: AAA family ATPase [Rhodocyclales bacterium]|nr:AAA family ATPase [Rhodocyclales bacterium]